MVRKLGNFDDWIDYFRFWQDSIGLDREELRQFRSVGFRSVASVRRRTSLWKGFS